MILLSTTLRNLGKIIRNEFESLRNLFTMNTVLERNKSLIDWTTSIFSIFWGVWWGIFINSLLQDPIHATNSYSLLDTNKLLVISSFVTALFVYFYVRWLREIKSLYSRTFTRTTKQKFFYAFLLWISFACLALALAYIHDLSIGIVQYGIVLTSLWMLLNILILASY